MKTHYKIFFILVLMYFSWQFGRIHDEGVQVYQPEYNHIVLQDRCEIVTDTLGNVICIWYNDVPYTYSEEVEINQ